MTSKGKYILAGLAAVAVIGAAAGAMADRGHYWGHGKGRQHFGSNTGIMGLSFGGPSYRICRGEPGEMTDHMLVRIEHRLKLSDDQKPVFEEFKTAARTAATKLHEACPERPAKAEDGKREKRTPIDRLAVAQTGLETSLEALKQFRPAAEKFYAALSDEQKAKLDRRGRGDKGKGHWKRDRGPDRGGDQEGPAPTPEE